MVLNHSAIWNVAQRHKSRHKNETRIVTAFP
jgi:hypothetical protein